MSAAVLMAGYAQAQFKLGVRAGFGVTTMYSSIDEVEGVETDGKTNYKPGIQVGL